MADFLFFLLQAPLSHLDYERLPKNLTRIPVSEELPLCVKGHISKVSLGISEKTLKNGLPETLSSWFFKPLFEFFLIGD